MFHTSLITPTSHSQDNCYAIPQSVQNKEVKILVAYYINPPNDQGMQVWFCVPRDCSTINQRWFYSSQIYSNIDLEYARISLRETICAQWPNDPGGGHYLWGVNWTANDWCTQGVTS